MYKRQSQRPDAHRKRSAATYRIVRYPDDFVIMVAGNKAHALWDEVAGVIAPLGLGIPVEKSRVCHLHEGFDFSRVPHPATPQERNQSRQRLHLLIQESAAFDHGESAGADE